MELEKLFKLPDETSKSDTLLLLLDVYVFAEAVYVLKTVSSNLPVPIACPFNEIDPVMLTEPVILWLSSKLSPNLVEPD